MAFPLYRRPADTHPPERGAGARRLTAARCVLALAACAGLALPAQADIPASFHALDTMAPAGRWAARLELRSNGYDAWFDDAGRRRPLCAEYDNVNLNSAVFPALAAFGPAASLGTTHFSSRVAVAAVSLTAGYGVNEDLTLGFVLPYAQIRHRVNFSVAGGNVGAGTAGVQQFLADPAYGYAYKPVRDTTTSGIGDPTVGMLWRFHKSARDSAVLALGAHIGLARQDDPDDLADVPVSDGSTDLEARVEYFRDLGHAWDLRLLARYRNQLPDHAEMRVPAAGQLIAWAATRERLRRDLGDYREYDVELGRAWGDWRGSLTWHLYDKDGDSYVSPRGTDTAVLAADTRVRADQWRAGLSWSGIRAWQAGRLPLPLIAKLEMQDTYGGRNFPKVRDVYLQVTSFF